MEDTTQTVENGSDDETTYDQKAALCSEYESMAFRVPAPGRVRVENMSYGDESDEHVYVVEVAKGVGTTACTCPSDKYREGRCKHRRSVENQPAVMQAATTNLSGAYPERDDETNVERGPIAADGGVETKTAFVRDDAGHGLVPIGEVKIGATDGGNEPDPTLDEDDPDVRPDSCTCSLNVLLDGVPPCQDCKAMGFATINRHDIPPADGGKGEPLEARR